LSRSFLLSLPPLLPVTFSIDIMPAVRLSRRRRSSLQAFTPAKAGIYGISRPVTFAPNVTPVTYVEPEDSSRSASPEPGSPSLAIFPPSQTPAPPPSRRRLPPGKRRSMGYIPRPPNAFMLFRADFVRQKHVPGSIETNHGSLSKIIGNCWRSLPLEEKRVWEVKAKHAKAEHKVQYPDYRFRPVHNKNKDKKKEKPASAIEDERRCEEVAQLLLEGKKGDELAAAVRNLDRMRSETPAVQPVYPVYQHRRSSSVPLPNDFYGHQYSNIAIPSIPFLSTASRPPSPVRSISRQQRMMYGHRRTSSAQPNMFTRSWTYPASLQRDPSPLPEVDTSLFEPSFMNNFSFSSQDLSNAQTAPFNIHELLTSLPHEQQNAPGPLDAISPHDMISHPLYTSSSGSSQQSLPDLDSLSWLPFDTSIQSQSNSHPSTAYSGSPTPSENASLPIVHAPKPVVADITPTSAVFADMWKMGTESYPDSQTYGVGLENGLNLTYDQAHDLSNCGHFDNMFEPTQQYDQGYGYEFDLIAQQ